MILLQAASLLSLMAAAAPLEEARLARERQQHWEALAAAELAVTAKGAAPAEMAEALDIIADARAFLGDEAGAAAALSRLLSLSPSPRARLRRAIILRADPPERLAEARRVIADGSASAALRLRARVTASAALADLGDSRGAEEELTAALSASPGDLDALGELARLKRDRPADAAALAERAEASAEGAPPWLRGSARRRAALARMDAGEPERAAAALRRSLEDDPHDLVALEILVTLREKLGQDRFSRARRLPPPAATPWPEDEEASSLERIDALTRGGKAAEAAEDLRRLAVEARWNSAWRQAPLQRAVTRGWMSLRRWDLAHANLDAGRDFQEKGIAELDLYARIIPRLNRPGLEKSKRSERAAELDRLANLRMLLDDREGARRAASEALSLVPGHPRSRDILERTKASR